MKSIQQANNAFDILNAKNNMQALLNVTQGYHQLSPQIMNDKYKHSVLSCMGAQGGVPSTITTAGLGVAKEVYDIVKKLPGAQKYGGYGAVIKDSWQDLKADASGLIQGYNNPTGNCYNIMKNYYSPNIK